MLKLEPSLAGRHVSGNTSESEEDLEEETDNCQTLTQVLHLHLVRPGTYTYPPSDRPGPGRLQCGHGHGRLLRGDGNDSVL